MNQLRDAIDEAERVIASLRAENADLRRRNQELREEIRTLGEGPCHYCDSVGWHEEDCPVLLDRVAERLPVG